MRRRFGMPLLLSALLATSAVAPATAGARPFPDQIPLPGGFAPEGIATGDGSTFFTGSLSGQGIWRGDYRTGEGSLLVAGGGPFVGMAVDASNRLWVAGGPIGTGYVFDADTGALIETFAFADPQVAGTFVNDVVVTSDAAYFTDSFRGMVYRVTLGPRGAMEIAPAIDLTALAPPEAGVFRLNGIVATPNGDTLIVINSTAGELYAIDALTGGATPIDLGGASVSAGDGLLLHGRSLYVVRNQLNMIAVVELAPDLESGVVVEERMPTGVDVPTTIARFGSSLYAVNARFGTMPGPSVPYWVSRVDR